MKAAARRHVAKEGDLARDGHKLLFTVTQPACRDQPLGIGVSRELKISETGACSTICPAYMTATESQISATTPRSWGDE